MTTSLYILLWLHPYPFTRHTVKETGEAQSKLVTRHSLASKAGNHVEKDRLSLE